MAFTKADASKRVLRLAFDGPSWSGKTYSALRLGHLLAQAFKTRVAMIDTERGSGSLYADVEQDGIQWDYDVMALTDYNPARYTAAIHEAERLGYGVIVIDSLTHAWASASGALAMKDLIAEQAGENDYTAWRKVTPAHDELVETMLQSKAHIIVTMRTKTEYLMKTEQVDGKTRITGIEKVGLRPIQREGMDYEFTCVIDMDQSHYARVSKSRCDAFADRVAVKPGKDFFAPLIDWLKGAKIDPAPSVVEFAPTSAAIDVSAFLNDLMAQYGAQAILDANNGTIPGTADELRAVQAALAGGK